jgi:hypothetical protein
MKAMTAQELDVLERKAKAADPTGFVMYDGSSTRLQLVDDEGHVEAADAAFIVAANPTAVLALIAEVRRLRARQSS